MLEPVTPTSVAPPLRPAAQARFDDGPLVPPPEPLVVVVAAVLPAGPPVCPPTPMAACVGPTAPGTVAPGCPLAAWLPLLALLAGMTLTIDSTTATPMIT